MKHLNFSFSSVKVDTGKRRAEQLANVFNVHPATIMFPDYEAE